MQIAHCENLWAVYTVALDVVSDGVIQMGETTVVRVVAASAVSDIESDASVSHKIVMFDGLAQGDESPWLGHCYGHNK